MTVATDDDILIELERRRRAQAAALPPPPVFRGAVAELHASTDHELMVAGPAETGKTFGTLWHLDRVLRENPRAQGAMVRKVAADIGPTVLRTYERVIAMSGSGATPYGGNSPQWFDYPNGARLYLGGMDRPGKVLSGERDIIYVNQAEELAAEDWQTLTTRATGRGAVVTHPQVIGDCNPGPAHHWIKHRPSLRVLESRHEDNPSLFDDAGQITDQGRRTLAVLDALEGVLRERLRFGRWVSAEGTVYAFDERRHMVDPFVIPPEWPRYRTIDFGFNNPFVCLWAAGDPDGRLYIYRQWYMSGVIVEDHARRIVAESQGERIAMTTADHDAEDRATLERHGVHTLPAYKPISVGIQAVATRLRPAGDGRPRLFVVRGSLLARDEGLAKKRQPVNTEQEFDAYVWPKDQSGRSLKEVPVDAYNHALDALRYLVVQLDLRGGAGGSLFR
ncbi:MAG: terminase [Acidobacteria bacterium]|nr:terminase [Acidobacteriota bacterium]